MAASEQTTEKSVVDINPTRVYVTDDVWRWVSLGIEEILIEQPQLTFTAGQIREALVDIGAGVYLWVTEEGFVITTGETDMYTGDRTFLVWLAWAKKRGTNLVVKHEAFFRDAAKGAGFKHIEVRTPIAALEPYLVGQGWLKDTVIYTKEL